MENACYFAKNGAAYITHTVSETIHATQQLLKMTSRMNKMKSSLEKLYYPQLLLSSLNLSLAFMNRKRYQKEEK